MAKTIQVNDIVLKNLISYDGTPLDFSFKNIKNLNGNNTLNRFKIY